jgi:hypothetical protein
MRAEAREPTRRRASIRGEWPWCAELDAPRSQIDRRAAGRGRSLRWGAMTIVAAALVNERRIR